MLSYFSNEQRIFYKKLRVDIKVFFNREMKIEKNSFFFSYLAKENVFEKEKEIYFFFHLEEEKRGKKEEKRENENSEEIVKK